MDEIPTRNPFRGGLRYWVARTESTQAEAKRLAAAGSFPSGSLVAADEQTAGRGRFPERRWESEPGKNLLFTLFLDPRAARLPSGLGLPGLPIRMGSALCVASELYAKKIGASFASPPRLKWPNDLMLGDRKAAGILCESGAAGVFIGVGLNCNQRAFPVQLAAKATSLAIELGAVVDRWDFLELLLKSMEAALGDADWRAKAEGRLWRKGEDARLLPGAVGSSRTPDADGEAGGGFLYGTIEGIDGTVEGIDGEGSLLFRENGTDRSTAYAAGELRVGELS